jgi:hypothetical protein
MVRDMKMKGCLGAVAVALFLLSPSEAHTECLVPPPPCDALKRSTHVFLADVQSAADMVSPQAVTFAVLESFKGIAEGQQTFEGRFGALTFEAVTFVPQRRYLVYANLQTDGILSTSCSRSREVPPTADRVGGDITSEIRALRSCG